MYFNTNILLGSNILLSPILLTPSIVEYTSNTLFEPIFSVIGSECSSPDENLFEKRINKTNIQTI